MSLIPKLLQIERDELLKLPGSPKSIIAFGRRPHLDLRVQKVQQMMRDSFSEKRSLGEFANSVNLSVWRLCHIFRSETGVSPIQYLRFLRMERARHLLQTSFLSVIEITRIVGLRDDSHFVRDFKKAYGETPTVYRTRTMGAQLNRTRTKDAQLNRTRSMRVDLNESNDALSPQRGLSKNSKNRQRK